MGLIVYILKTLKKSKIIYFESLIHYMVVNTLNRLGRYFYQPGRYFCVSHTKTVNICLMTTPNMSVKGVIFTHLERQLLFWKC